MKASPKSAHGLLEALAPPDGTNEESGDGGGADADTKTAEELISAVKGGDVEGVKNALHAYVVHCMSEDTADQGEEEPDEGGNPDDED